MRSAPLVIAVMLAAPACVTTAPQRPTIANCVAAPTPSSARPAPTAVNPHAQGVRAALDRARERFRQGDARAVDAAIAEASAAAGDDVQLGNEVATTLAAMRADHGDFAGAAELLTARIVVAANRNDPSEFTLHDTMIFLAEGLGDRARAVLEATAMRAVSERWNASPDRAAHARLGYLWQRAHTLRMFADTLTGPAREAAIRYAQRAREDFAEHATSLHRSLASIVVLTEQFASQDHDAGAALAAARSLDLTTLDAQDLYLTLRAFESAGDTAGAASVRARLESDTDLSVLDAVYRWLAAHSAGP